MSRARTAPTTTAVSIVAPPLTYGVVHSPVIDAFVTTDRNGFRYKTTRQKVRALPGQRHNEGVHHDDQQYASGRGKVAGHRCQHGRRAARTGDHIIRRVEAGEHQEPGTIAFYKQYGPLLVSLHEDGALWLMDSVEATRAFREAQTFTAAEMRALYGFFWSIALVEVCDIALALGDDRTPEQVAPESAIGEATPEQWERYNQAYLKERYAWAERLLCIVVEYGHELEPHIDPKLRPVWEAALKRA